MLDDGCWMLDVKIWQNFMFNVKLWQKKSHSKSNDFFVGLFFNFSSAPASDLFFPVLHLSPQQNFSV